MNSNEVAHQMYIREYNAMPESFTKTEKHETAKKIAITKCKSVIDCYKSDKYNPNLKYYNLVLATLEMINAPR